MTFPVKTESHLFTESNDFGTVSTFLKSLYLNPSFKKIDQVCIDQFQNLLKTQWHSSFQYSLEELVTAFTHSTFSHEWGNQFPSYEKVEFIGDGVINLLIAEKLYALYPTYKEGQLSKLRGALVNEDELAVLAYLLKMDQVLLFGKGDFKKIEKDKYIPKSIMADSFEAVLGVLYLKYGLQECLKFLDIVLNLYNEKYGFDFINEDRIKNYDPKSILQEKLVKSNEANPDYRSLEISQGLFRVELWIGDELVLVKNGNNKKNIEKELAKEYLEKLN